jgi:hypothetical protein
MEMSFKEDFTKEKLGELGTGGKFGENQEVALGSTSDPVVYNPNGVHDGVYIQGEKAVMKNGSSTPVKYPSGASMTPGSVGAGASGGAGTSVIRDVGSKSSIQKLAEDYVNSNYDDFTKGTDYESLVKRYSAQGRQAMDDTIGQMAARTGGLASSYAASAGQQAYGGWMEKLEDAARSLYDSQQSERLSKLNVAQGIYDRDVANEQWNKTFEYQQNQDTKEEAENNLYAEIYYGGKYESWEAYKEAGGTLDEKSYLRIVKQAEEDKTNKESEKTEADELEAQEEKKRAQNEVMMMWAAGQDPSDDDLKKCGWVDETGKLTPLGEAYKHQATYVEPTAPTELTTYMSGLPVMRDRDGEEYMAGMVYYGSDGKTYELPIGSNPYANGKINRDLYDENGKLDTSRLMPGSNYQPNGIKVDGNYKELSATGLEANFEDGSSAPIYKLDDDLWYYWSDAENAYISISEEDKKKIMGGE